MTRSASILVALIILFTFPLWIGLALGLFGLVIGLIGGAIGIVIGVFGAVFGAIFGMFKALLHGIFGWGHDYHMNFPEFNINGYVVLAIFILAYLVSTKKKK